MNAYVRPLMERYVGDIRNGLDGAGIAAPLTIMQSSGGVMTADDAKQRPVLALESGPAAGVVAALGMARRLGFANVITFDMGGTTAKASLIENGAVSRGREYEVGGSLSAGSRLMRGSGELLRIPTIDIAEVGAGGGSLAWLDPAGGLQVGPRSRGRRARARVLRRAAATSRPSPTRTSGSATSRKGRSPTARSPSRASSPSGRSSASPRRSGSRPTEVAAGIHAIANARMTRALRSVSSEKGRDPREFALLAYGGAGPVHAVGLAEELGCRTVLVPALAGLFSSLGLLYARPEFHAVRATSTPPTCHLDARTVDPAALDAVFGELAASLEGVELVRSAELRYGGQTWEIEIEVGDPVDLPAVIAAFEDEHERLYGIRGEDGSPIEIRALRLAALGRSSAVDRLSLVDGFAVRSATRETVLGELPVRTRASVGESAEPGPMLIDEYDTTVVVRPGWTVRRDLATETLILERA